MYLVRLHMKNGTMLQYVFADEERAKKVRDLCANAIVVANAHPPRADAAVCTFWDAAGREASVNGADLSISQMIDVEKEVQADTELSAFADMVKRQTMSRLGLIPEQQTRSTQPSPGEHAYHPATPAGWADEPPAQPSPPPPTGRISRFAG